MTAEQQLERSVLEGKEREELSAIAQAMSLKTNSRTKKADIIDQILDATGVTSGSQAASNGDGEGGDTNGVKPSRRTRSVSASASSGSDEAADTVAGSPSAGAGDATPTTASADSEGAGSEVSAGGTPSAGVTATAEASSSSPSTDSGPAIFVEPPDLATGTEPAPRQNGQGGGGQGGGGGNRNRQNQNQNRQGGSQGDGDVGNRRSRRRRGRERGGGQGGELQGGGGQDQPYTGELVEVKGMLDLRDEGYGFLRCEGYLPSTKDVYVSISQARRFALRRGDYIEGACRPASNNEKYPALLRIDSVSGLDPEAAKNRPKFEDLTPLFPDSRLNLEMPGDKDNLTARIVDLLSPIGKGQRGMIVSPPKAGKTTVMKQIAHSIEANNPDVHLMVLLVDERPEEVTDMRRTVKGEVIASTFDRPSEEHTQVAELAIERAKRLVEMGRDVVIILDGITRLARAYNLAAPATGRIMSGGVDSGALYPPKKFFGAARNIEEGGSLTILASALVETGSKMDEVIFEEFKGTGNMELRLDRRLSERRLYPAIDVNASSTRHEELLFERGQLQQVWKLRRVLNALASDGKDAAGLELLMDKIKTTGSNDEFLAEIAKGPGA
ncbi:MAG TPA: transcription termination factor Rho [Acidimicrobiales bacterium]|jgi:transcription termination factor Rho|nr:transcription termination factor Rho [Acidimicrobiales bacterium]